MFLHVYLFPCVLLSESILDVLYKVFKCLTLILAIANKLYLIA